MSKSNGKAGVVVVETPMQEALGISASYRGEDGPIIPVKAEPDWNRLYASIGINLKAPKLDKYTKSLQAETNQAIKEATTNSALAQWPVALALTKAVKTTKVGQTAIGAAHFRPQSWVSQHVKALEWALEHCRIVDGKPLFKNIDLADEFVARCHGYLKRCLKAIAKRNAIKAAKKSGQVLPTSKSERIKATVTDALLTVVKRGIRDNLTLTQVVDELSQIWKSAEVDTSVEATDDASVDTEVGTEV